MIEDLWYKNAVIYCLDVETFQDGNGDGVGDFLGLKHRLDYLAGLGVTCIWLLPFYPTPNRDNGYDVTDFYGVDRRLGDLGDFVAFTHLARNRGMKVIVDLVVNHTSDKHPWFQAARSDPNSRFRDYYLWSKTKPKDAHKGMVFPGVQKATWTKDPRAGAWYFHRFYEFQPDLNVSNPHVREEILKIMGYWLELGVSGFRVDAVPFLIELEGVKKPHAKDEDLLLLREMREFLSWRAGDAVLLAEANVPMDTVSRFFENGMQLVFNFQANQHFFSGIVQGDARGIATALTTSPKLAHSAQWANFLRNHDELDLGRLDDEVREQVFDALAPEESMRIYGRGIRRRLASMFGGDLRRLKLAYSLMFALPGTPVLWYGEEIGMGENLALPERQPVRTPMQWSDDKHAGFTQAPKPLRPLLSKGPFNYRQVNVNAQQRDEGSLLNWLERLIRKRKQCPELGWGEWRVLKTRKKNLLAVLHSWRGAQMVTVHNLSGEPCSLELEPVEEAHLPLVDVFDGSACAVQEGRYSLLLDGYGHRWFRVGRQDGAPRGAGPEP